MLGLDWCHLYNVYNKNNYNSEMIEEELKKLFLNENDKIISFKGVYALMLCKNYNPFAEKLLHLRGFSKKDKATAYERHCGNCAICKQHFEIDELEADHKSLGQKEGSLVVIIARCYVLVVIGKNQISKKEW